MGAAPSKMSAASAAPFQTPDESPYRMPDSAPMGTSPQAQQMRTQLSAELARSRMPDQLQSMGNPAASYMQERVGQMAERQDVGDELGGMGSMGGISQAAVRGADFERQGRRGQLRKKMANKRAQRGRRAARGRV